MAKDRPIVKSEEGARGELVTPLSRPSWRESSHSLPFGDLSDDEFELLCFLLLKAEHPNHHIAYYGKTGDLGRDIVHSSSKGTCRLIQCKRYTQNVGISDIREELAKLAINIHNKKIPTKPDEVCFYVVPDLTSPAKTLLEDQEAWRKILPDALQQQLGSAPGQDLLDFSAIWWPIVPSEHAISLTARCRKQPALLDEFFRTRKVIDGSLKDVEDILRREGDRLIKEFRPIRPNANTSLEPLGRDTILSAFTLASKRLLSWPTTVMGNRWLDRRELEALVDRITSEKSSVSILLGERGTGKSALLARLGQLLTESDKGVLAVKADYLPRTIDSEAKLSEWLRLPTMLSDCVFEAARDDSVVVVIDQLDALGDLVDLHSERLNVLLDLISRLSREPNVHIIASCRAFEFQHDSRLNSIDADSLPLQLPKWAEVCQVLHEAFNIDASAWPAELQNQLSAPQHLKLLLEHLVGSSEYDITKSYQQLLDDLWESEVLNADGPAGRSDLLSDMADEMAEKELPWLPVAQFYDRHDLLKPLEASDILHRPKTTGTVGFRHPSLFEHALARNYAIGDSSLAAHVLERQNALFVRPSLWNTLRYLREVNTDRYHHEIQALCKAELRLHIKYLLIEFLGQIQNPSVEELTLLRQWIEDGILRSRVLLSIAGNEDWFKLLNESHIPPLMELPAEDSWTVVLMLRSALPFAKVRCLELVRKHWLGKTDQDWLTFNVYRDLEDWTLDEISDVCGIINRISLENYNVMGIAESVSSSVPELAPKIIYTQLNKELQAVKNQPPITPPKLPEDADDSEQLLHSMKNDPKGDYEELMKRRQGFHELPEIAAAAPKAYLDALWPWFIEVLKPQLHEPSKVVYAYRETHSLRFDLTDDSCRDNALILSIDHSLCKLAEESADSFLKFVAETKTFDAMIVQRMLCRSFSAASEKLPEESLRFLIADRRRLVIGDYHDRHRDSRQLIRQLNEHLNEEQFKRLEDAIVAWNEYRDDIPEETSEDRFKRQKWSREGRLRLLKTLPLDRLSSETQKLVRDEEIALPEYRDFDHEPITAAMTEITSPMSVSSMEKASDSQILKLFAELVDSTGSHHPRNWSRGGAEQASREFGRLAESDPERAMRLLRQLRPEDQQKPAIYAMRALGNNKDITDAELFSHIVDLDTAGFCGADFRSEAASACGQRANKRDGLPEHICTLLHGWLREWTEWDYFRHDKDDFGSQNELTGRSLLWNRGGYVYPHGSFWVLYALTYGYLRQKPSNLDRWMQMLEGHLDRPEGIYVWKVFTEELRFLGRCDKKRAGAFVAKLFEKYPQVRDSQFGVVLLARLRNHFPADAYHQYIVDVRDGQWMLGKQAFGELIGLNYIENEFSEWTTQEVDQWQEDGDVSTGLAHAIAHSIWVDRENRVRSTDLFERLATTSNDKTARALMGAFTTIDALPANNEERRLLAAVYTNDLLLKNASEDLFIGKLEDVVTHCPDLVLGICNKVVDLWGKDLSDIRTSAASASSYLVNISMTLQRLTEYRDSGLALFERLLEMGVYDASTLLQTLDRRPISTPVRTPRRRRRRAAAR